jgi:hypothetical protein
MRVRAIVFDTNVFGKGALPKVETIENWARVCSDHDAELWIPRVVAYELAEHVLAETSKTQALIEAHDRNRERWGIPRFPIPDAVTVDDVLEALEDAGAVLVPLNGDDAIEALTDQVLQRGAGARKERVKTGAADSAWVRSVIAANGGNGDGLIVVTGDVKALVATCAELGIEPPRHVPHLGKLHPLEDATQAASDELRGAFKDWLAMSVDSSDGIAEDIWSYADLSGAHWWDNQQDRDFHFEWEHQDSFLARDDATELVGILVHDAWANTLSGRIRMVFAVEEQYARQDRWGDHPEYMALRYPGVIEADVTVFLDSEGQPGVVGSLDDVELIDPEPQQVYEEPL